MVKSIWQYGIDQWIVCNEHIYGNTKEEQHEKKNQEVNAQVRRIHQSNKNKVQRQDRHLFEMSVTKRLEQTLDREKKWIECIALALYFCLTSVPIGLVHSFPDFLLMLLLLSFPIDMFITTYPLINAILPH